MHLLIPAAASTNELKRAQKQRFRCCMGACALVMLALCAPILAGKTYVADDLGQFHLPLRAFYAEQLQRGEPFDWMPSLYAGFYVTGEGQLGGYHPLHWLLYRWLPLRLAFDLELVLSYPLMLAGMYVLLRRLIGQRDAALLGALSFTFSGFNLLHFVHPNAIAVVAHIPWLVFAADVAIRGHGRTTVVALSSIALLTGSQLLLGYPQYVWLSFLIEAAFVLWRISVHQPGRWTVALLAGAKALGLLIGAVQVLPTLDALGDSVRGTADLAMANSGSLHPLNLVQLVAPYLFETRVVGQNTHELGLYCGAVPLMLCVWLCANRPLWDAYRPLIKATLMLGAFTLVLAFGQYGLLYSLQTSLPLINRFRFPCRAIVLAQLAVAVAAAIGFALLTRHSRLAPPQRVRRRRALWIVVAVSAVLAIACPLMWRTFTASPALVWTGPLLIAVAALLVGLAERGVRGALVGLILFAAIDLASYGLSYSVYRHTARLEEYIATAAPADIQAGERVALDGSSSGLRTGNRILLAGVHRVDGYAGLEPARQLDYRKTSALRVAGASWKHDADTKGWQKIERPLPRVRMLAQVEPAGAALDPDGFDIETSGVAIPHVALDGGAPGEATMTEDRPGRIEVTALAPSRQVVVLAESFHPGWEATVDGRSEPVVRVNGDFMGCVVDAGQHQVVYHFNPRSLQIGTLLSLLGLGLLMACATLGLMRARRPS